MFTAKVSCVDLRVAPLAQEPSEEPLLLGKLVQPLVNFARALLDAQQPVFQYAELTPLSAAALVCLHKTPEGVEPDNRNGDKRRPENGPKDHDANASGELHLTGSRIR